MDKQPLLFGLLGLILLALALIAYDVRRIADAAECRAEVLK